MRILVLVAAIALSLRAIVSPHQEAARLQVVVLEAGTGRPLPNAGVWIRLQKSADPVEVRNTEDDGSLTVANLAPGTYDVHVFSPAHLSINVRAPRGVALPTTALVRTKPVHVYQPGRAVVELSSGTSSNVTFHLPRGAAITGSVVGSVEPVDGAAVTLLEDLGGAVGPHTVVATVSRAVTKPDGSFEFVGLRPGSYRVAVNPRPNDFRALNDVYYPSTPEIEDSQLVAIEDESIHIVIRVREVPTVAVSGRVVDPPAAGRRELLIRRLDENTGDVITHTLIPIASDGTFTALQTRSAVHGLAYARYQKDGRVAAAAFLVLHVGDRPLSGLRLQAVAAASMSGRFLFQGTTERNDTDGPVLSAWPAGPDGELRQGFSATSTHDVDRFEIAGLFGSYRLNVDTPPGWLPSAILLEDGRDVLDMPFDVEAGRRYSGVRVVLTDDVATIEGTVPRGDLDGLFGGLMVFAIPTDPAMWDARRQVAAHVDSAGRFTLRNVRPGRDYFVAACAWPCNGNSAERRYHELSRTGRRIFIDRPGVYRITLER